MSRAGVSSRAAVLAAAALAVAAPASAQPGDAAGGDAAPAAPLAEPAAPGLAQPTISAAEIWTEWAVAPVYGERFIDDEATLRAVLAPAVERRQTLTDSTRAELVAECARVGYELVAIEVERPQPGVVRAVLRLRPRLVVRHVDVVIDRWRRISVKDELARRMRLRVGEVLEADPEARGLRLRDEAERLREYLQDDGFFEARVQIAFLRTGAYGAVLTVRVTLGPEYQVGDIAIENEARLAVPGAELRPLFRHCGLELRSRCWFRERFSRARHQADLERVTELYRRRGFPAVRVRSDYQTETSFDRRTRTVSFTLRIDERRELSTEFEGNDLGVFPDDALRAQLTFDASSSADDVEVVASALAIQRYYQQRGWFDAAVSWERDRQRVQTAAGERAIDKVRFRIDAGRRRAVREVQVVGTAQLREDDVRAALRTRAANGGFRLLGGASAATREQLEADAERIRALYRGRGFLDVAVAVAAAPSREGLGAAWAAAAALGADQDAGELFVRFTVTEGTPTLVDAVAVEFAGPHVAAEAEVRGQLAIRPGEPYQLAALEAAGRRLQDWYWRLGRPRARVTLDVSFPTRHRAVATYRVEERGPVRVGKVVVRGNFRTRPWVVLEELGLPEGALLNDERYARGLRRLRGTGLFSAVAVTLLDFDDVALPSTNVLVRVEERHDVRAYLDAEAGYSDQKKVYARLAPSIPNLLGVGWALEAGVTLGFDLLGERDFATQVYEVTTRVPRWLTRRVTGGLGPDLEASLFLRVQDTERFGELQTFGGSLAAARVWQRAGGDGLDGRSLAATVRYDFRRRSRQEDAVRLAGNNGNVARSTIFNRTGAIGLTLSLDQRVDARGNLNPLSPERGFKLEGGVSLASPYLLSQDTFVKVSALGQWIRQLSSRLQLRLEGRFDHGIPLGGAVLLPEVERFFAGGDDTVRGFEQDRLATELVETALPPLGQVSQVEVLPAGGNLRVLTSVDLQVRLWRLGSVPLASAVFVDAGLITNAVRTVDGDSIRPAVGVALARVLSPFGPLSLEWAVPLRPGPYDPPLGRLHFVVALRY